MALVGRHREMAEASRLLASAADGRGGVLLVIGPPGSGRTELAAAVAAEAARRGFEVLHTGAVRGQPGMLVWARLLGDAGAPDDLAKRVLDEPGPLDLDAAARALTAGGLKLLVIDDLDHGGQEALPLLRAVAARAATSTTAVLAASVLPLGFGVEVRLDGLNEDELAQLVPEVPPQAHHAIWLASGGLPGVARSLADGLAAGAGNLDSLAFLALTAPSHAEFLDVDTGLIRLLELALSRAPDEAIRSRLLARLARELLGDASAGPRRRALADEALTLAREGGEPQVLAEVLDARLHALWDPAGAEDRLATASEIVDLARKGGDGSRERRGLFWRFVALMELGRVGEAEAALAAFEHAAAAAGDRQAMVMVTARHAMLAAIRGRFDEAARLAEQVAEDGARAGLADTERLAAALQGQIGFFRGPAQAFMVDQMLALARRLPGHFMEATMAPALLMLGREDEAQAEMDRVLPAVLAGSGPRWLGAAAMLAFTAAHTGDTAAATRLREVLLPYRGRLVVLGGANSCLGPTSFFLGLLATRLGQPGEAVDFLEEAAAFSENAGALPGLALCLDAAAAALSLRQEPGDRQKAAAYRDRARAISERLALTDLPSRLAGAPGQWSLRRDGQDWLLEAGQERARMHDSRGLHYLRALLAAPGSDIPALDLAAGGPGLAVSRAEPLSDATARDRYRRRIRELDAELAAADRVGDNAAAERAHQERQALLGELRRVTGLAGRPRRADADAERARVNVTRTIRAAIDRITAAAPIAGAHLQSSIHTGTACRYQPAAGGPTRWHT